MDVPFPLSSGKGLYAASAGRLINAYSEKMQDGRTRIVAVPGIANFATVTGGSGCRGMIAVGSTLLVAMGQRLATVTQSGGANIVTDIGALAGDDRVEFAINNKSPAPDIVAVTDSTAYVVSLTTGAASYPDADVGSPISVTAIDGYFVFGYANGRMRSTALNDTAINTLDTAVAESRPDELYRVVAIGRYLYAVGSQTVEVWANAANPTGFPFSRVETIARGAASAGGIAGSEPEWANTLIFAGNDGVVYRVSGVAAEAISTPSVSREIEALTDKSTLSACVYAHQGHVVWALSCNDWTWCHDLSTGAWFERASHLSPRWRVSASQKAFGAWMVGEVASGRIGALSAPEGREFGESLPMEVVSATISGFPERAVIDRLDIDMLAGVGIATGEGVIQSSPRVLVDLSRDGGATFGTPWTREIGRQGLYQTPIRVTRLGTAGRKGFQVRVRCSDPVERQLFGGVVTASPRGEA